MPRDSDCFCGDPARMGVGWPDAGIIEMCGANCWKPGPTRRCYLVNKIPRQFYR